MPKRPAPTAVVATLRGISAGKTKPRVLLLSASSGAGHVRAAQALEKSFAARGDCTVEHIDTIHYVSKLFKTSTTKRTSRWCDAPRT